MEEWTSYHALLQGLVRFIDELFHLGLPRDGFALEPSTRCPQREVFHLAKAKQATEHQQSAYTAVIGEVATLQVRVIEGIGKGQSDPDPG